jgi:CubicO group peptidase (beta-lactamase class C family)
MRRLLLPGILTLSALLAFTPTQAQETAADFAPLVEVIETQMQLQGAPGLAVAVIAGDAMVFSQGFGVRSIETDDPVTTATLFRIGSTTKPLTAVGLLRLVEAGLVDLDAPVVTYVPEFAVDPRITVRQVLSHTAGLNDASTLYGRRDAPALEAYVASFTPESAFAPPGAVLSYASPGFDIAGRIIETVSGQFYEDYMADHVFRLLNMPRTTLRPNIAITYPVAVGHSPGPQGLQVVRPDPDNVAEYPAGFVFSTVEDLANLARLLLNDGALAGVNVLRADLVEQMQTPVLEIEPGGRGYGLGLFTGEWRGLRQVGHGGAILGYATAFELLPDQGVGVIVLANQSGFNAQPIVSAAFDLLVDPPPAPTAAPPPQLSADELAAYAGDYQQSRVDGQVVISLRISLTDDGRLLLLTPDAPPAELRPVRPEVFNAYLPNAQFPVTQVSFARDADGRVQYLIAGFRAVARVR